MKEKLTFELLQKAIQGTAAAFRTRTILQPAAGEGTKVFPPTYSGAVYATETRRVRSDDGTIQEIPCVLLDSVQSQANRHEEALQRAIDEKKVIVPLVQVDFSGEDLHDAVGTITSLQAPHRIADAIFRDSFLDGKKFRETTIGKRLDTVSLQNATALYELCPTALVFGLWDSSGPKGGLGAKFQRAFVSEIVGINFALGRKTSSRIDPLGIRKEAGPVYRTADGSMTMDPESAIKNKKGYCLLFGKSKGKDVYHDSKSDVFPDAGKPSKANHGNIVPDFDRDDITKQEKSGGVTFDYAEQTAVLSLAALRRLHFPLREKGKTIRSSEIDIAGQTVLAAMTLYSAALVNETGFDLRSRCLLWSKSAFEWQLLVKGGEDPKKITFSSHEALDVFNEAVSVANTCGLTWESDPIVLQPSGALVTLVQRSQEITATDLSGE